MKIIRFIKDNIKEIIATSLIFLIGCNSNVDKPEEEFSPDVIISPKIHSIPYQDEPFNNNVIPDVSDDNDLSAIITFDEYLNSEEEEFKINIIISEKLNETKKEDNEEKPKVLTKHLSK